MARTNLLCTFAHRKDLNLIIDYVKQSYNILIHRKKDTNTLYTVNALNEIIKAVNNGILDKTFIISWENYKNSLLLTNNDGYRRIVLELYKRIDV